MKIREYIRLREKSANAAERAFTARIRRAFRESVQPIYRHLELLGATGLNVNMIDTKPISRELNWLYADWGYKYGKRFAKNLPVQKKDFWEDELKRILGEVAASKVTEIVNTTKKLAEKTIRQALTLANEGASIDKIQKSIKTSIESEGGLMSAGRARTIARTEVISASNTATHEAVRQSGAKVEHKWLTGGSNIRDTHIAAEAQGWIPFDQPFQVGDYRMMHPGDPSGGAEEVINCKCVEIFRTID